MRRWQLVLVTGRWNRFGGVSFNSRGALLGQDDEGGRRIHIITMLKTPIEFLHATRPKSDDSSARTASGHPTLTWLLRRGRFSQARKSSVGDMLRRERKTIEIALEASEKGATGSMSTLHTGCIEKPWESRSWSLSHGRPAQHPHSVARQPSLIVPAPPSSRRTGKDASPRGNSQYTMTVQRGVRFGKVLKRGKSLLAPGADGSTKECSTSTARLKS